MVHVSRQEIRRLVLASLMLASGATRAVAQRSLDPDPAKTTLPELSLPKTSPGALDTGDFNAQGVSVVSSRKRGIIPKHAAPTVKTVSAPDLAPLQRGISGMRSGEPSGTSALPVALPISEDEEPANGLTLDQAIARMMAENIELRAFSKEIPQAEADLITAGLRSNPLLYADTQFIPYGANNASHRPVGPTQYDVALIVPVDVSGKRRERVRVACAARSVTQAQYQDAVRRQITNLGHAFVDLQVAYQAQTAISRARNAHEKLVAQFKADPLKKPSELKPLEIWSGKWSTALDDANDTLGDAREAFGLLLNVSPEESSNLLPKGWLRVDPPVVPLLDELIRIALRFRPDLAAARLGINRADAEIGLAKANRIDDVILFLDPLSYQDNRPAHLPSGRSWDIGITMPLPIRNRNQGNISKARTNAQQTRLEYAALERRVISEIRLAAREVKSSRDLLDKIESTTRPEAIKAIRAAEDEIHANKIKADDYVTKLEDEQDAAKQQRDALVRYRRSTLDLNSAVGVRLLP